MGLDVHLEISRARPGRSLEEALRAAVVEGRLAPGTRLPATRSLASDLGLSRTTVAAVFAQLTAEGWLTARVGAGTWVAEREVGARPGLVTGLRRPGVRVDLRAGIPDTTGFPRREWLSAVRRAAGSSAANLGYPDPAGVPRAARPGARRVAVEEYGHASHRALVASAGPEVVALPVDEDGAVVGVLTTTPPCISRWRRSSRTTRTTATSAGSGPCTGRAARGWRRSWPRSCRAAW